MPVYVRPSHWSTDFAIRLAVFALFTVLSTATWTGFDVALRGLLRNPGHARIFNWVMAVLLVASIAPMVI